MVPFRSPEFLFYLVFSAVVKCHAQKQLGKRKIYTSRRIESTIEGSQGINWRQESEQQPWRKAAYFLVLHSLLSCLCYSDQVCLIRGGTAQSGLGVPTSIINQETFLTDMPTAQSDNAANKVVSSLTGVYVKLTKINKQRTVTYTCI